MSSKGQNGASKKRARAMRNKLWILDPRCYYCGQITVLPKSLGIEIGDTCPPNMATLEHIYNKNHPSREQEKYALACNECNGIKGNIEAIQPIDLEQLRDRTIKKLIIINKMLEFEKEEI